MFNQIIWQKIFLCCVRGKKLHCHYRLCYMNVLIIGETSRPMIYPVSIYLYFYNSHIPNGMINVINLLLGRLIPSFPRDFLYIMLDKHNLWTLALLSYLLLGEFQRRISTPSQDKCFHMELMHQLGPPNITVRIWTFLYP